MTAPETRSPADAAEAAWPDDAIEVARIADAWGIKGWFKVQAHSTDPQAIFATRRWFLKPAETAIPGMAAGKGTVPKLLKILSLREHGDGLVASAEGVSDRNGAEALRGARVFVSRTHFPKADPDEFYWVDLVGLTVVNRQGETLGEVIGLLDTGPHAVLRIQPAGLTAPVKPEQERLIPFVSAFVDDVSLQERRISVDWGLDF
ncbi:ribosome maturation factor RimM [Pelomonas sp. BJYL3]|uniref:ribosome maturation factor RimM n=1 Tax=Pelomonas sp. BJYL3 TaxID=2976697 RepID=UPI0022B30B62|nr:ribosome maturation factor RimM [Pelomonas sp. BJYL3]